MKYRIAICDDEQNQIEYITSIVASWSAHEGHSCEIRTFASAEAFLFEYEEDKAYDILLLDVEMKNMNGIELAKRIRKDNNRAEIIFITSHFEFVGEGYEVDALHYLIKPISAEKLTQVLTKAAEKLSVEPPSVVISCEGETVKLVIGIAALGEEHIDVLGRISEVCATDEDTDALVAGADAETIYKKFNGLA